MSYNIAVAGKGGTGKTSLTGLLIDTLIHEDKKPILVVDADANANINEVSAIDRDDAFELYHSDLIIWNNRMETIEVDKVGSNPDVLPTILNLFGIEYDSRLIIGQDLLSDKEGLVVLANRSWISDKVKYNSVTSEIIPRYEGIEVDEEYIAKLNNLVDNQFKISNMVLQNNYYKKLFKTNEEDKDSNYVKSDLEGKID